MKFKCNMCEKLGNYYYEKGASIFNIIDTKKSDPYYPCCSKECFKKWWKQ